MRKVKKDLLIEEINRTAPKGHEVTKLHTSSHSDKVIRVECDCGNQHPTYFLLTNEEWKVVWKTNLEIKWGM